LTANGLGVEDRAERTGFGVSVRLREEASMFEGLRRRTVGLVAFGAASSRTAGILAFITGAVLVGCGGSHGSTSVDGAIPDHGGGDRSSPDEGDATVTPREAGRDLSPDAGPASIDGATDGAGPADAGPADGRADAAPVCNVVCSTNHVAPVCTGSTCTGTCAHGFADCNGNLRSDGCEVSTDSDPANCGTCGTRCPVPANTAASCANFVCGASCLSGFANCNATMTDGCEVDVETDPANCGACGTRCPVPANTSASCTASVCGASCLSGFSDCNGTMTDGCEVDVETDPANCGACTLACSTNNVATAACFLGTCTSTCAPGFADCNADKRIDGCETSTSSDVANCGGCGVVCRGTVGRGCQNGACNPTCDDGIQNQGEADVDCGGPCARCDVWRSCVANSDCRTGVCQGSRCAPVPCAKGFGLPGPPILHTGSNPVAVRSADLNGDGKPDLAIVNSESNTVSVFFGQGDSTFVHSADYATGGRPSSVAIGDLDGDGKPDLAVPNFYDRTVSVFLDNGDGTFAPQVTYSTETGPISVAIGDLNSDGKPDLVVATQFTCDILPNAGGGTFGPFTDITPGGLFVAIGDLNGDGNPDIVTNDNEAVRVFLNAGNGSFAPPGEYFGLAEGSGLALGDLNGDGRLDVVAGEIGVSLTSFTGDVAVFLNNGDGTLGAKTDVVAGPGTDDVAIADLTGDGKADVVTANGANGGPGTVTVLAGVGDGTLMPPIPYLAGFGAGPLAIDDFDGNGALDVVVANIEDTASVLLNHGGGVLEGRTDYATSPVPQQILFGDVTGDGLLDIVVANTPPGTSGQPGSVNVFRNTGGHSFTLAARLTTTQGPTSAALGDMNRDGALDIVTSNMVAGTVSVFLNQGGSFGASTDVAAGSGPGSVVVADFDADGAPDVAVSTQFGIRILYNGGNGTSFSSVDYATGEIAALGLPHALAAGDMNYDGLPDLARAQQNPGIFTPDYPALATLINQGGRDFSVSTVALSAYPTFVSMADITGGGTLQPLVGLQNATVLAGSGTYAASANPESGTYADMNGDRLPDLVVASDGGILSVFLATSLGVFGPRLDYVMTGDTALAAADLDNDGRPDIASGGSGYGISLIPNVCLP
jgi:hypothetical protein